MAKIGRKLLLVALAGTAMVTATPAHAWYSITYLYPNGSVAGGQIYCDDGTLVYQEGIVTSNYSYDYHFGEPPC